MKIFKSLSWLCLIMGLLVLFTGCPNPTYTGTKYKMDFTCFDTVSYVYSYANDDEELFNERCDGVFSILNEYHKLFDIYHEYSGVTNLKTINRNAGGEPIQVDQKLFDFLVYAKQMYQTTNGETNVMMGSVLSLWHDCREQASANSANARIPTEQELLEANLHTDISLLVLDEQNKTVRITDANASIDVGALGKGYATEQAGKYLESINANAYVLNIGGNIRIVGTKLDGSAWKTGIKNPLNQNTYASFINIANTSCVTSGDYIRYYVVGGVKYHHIIDKDTLMPSDYFSGVTVITKDSGLADALSTALFSMSYENGLELVQSIGNVEVLWITKDGTQLTTPGYNNLIAD